MKIYYKIIKKNTVGETNIVVRFWSDVLTENYLCIDRADNGSITKCRTDYLINIPIVPMSAADLEQYIRSHCPYKWFDDEEKRVLANSGYTDQDLAAITSMVSGLSTVKKTLTFDSSPKTNTEWATYKKKLVNDKRDQLITSGGFPLTSSGVKYWFHSNSISTSQQLGLISAAIIAKMSGATDSKILHPIPWRTMGGQSINLTVGITLSLLQASFTQQGLMFTAANNHKAALDTSSDTKNYNINSGWPEVFVG